MPCETAGLQAQIKELFLDDVEIEDVERLQRVLHQPKLVQDKPVLAPKYPWDKHGTCVRAVIYDAELGRFRMWYQTYYPYPSAAKKDDRRSGLPLRSPKYSYGAAYAESEDGIHWNRPKLGRVFWDKVDTNLAIRGWSAPVPWSVIHRPEHPNPHERYRMFVWDSLPIPGQHEVIGMCTYVSDDGYRWRGLEWNAQTREQEDPQPLCYAKTVGNYRYPKSIGPGECHGLFWDQKTEKFIDYCRTNNGSVRAIGRIESADGTRWTYPERIVLQPDLQDPSLISFHSGAPLRCGENIVLILHCMRSEDLTIYCQLAASRDGVQFTRVADRQTFIPQGPKGSPTAGMVLPWSVVRFPDRWMIYAAARSGGMRVLSEPDTAVLYEMRPDGFVSFTSNGEEGSLVTRSFTWLHDTINVNTKAEGGRVSVEVLDATRTHPDGTHGFGDRYQAIIDGFGKDDCIPVTEDSVDAALRFKTHDLRELRGRYVKLRFYIRDADFYSWTRYRHTGK